MKRFLSCVFFVVCVRSESEFFFPDQISAHANSNSQAWSDGNGNAKAASESQASVNSRNPLQSGQYGQNYPIQGYDPQQGQQYPGHGVRPGGSLAQSQGQAHVLGGQGTASANSQSGAQGFGNNYQQTGLGYAPQQGYNPFPLGGASNAQSQANAQATGNGALANSQSTSQSQNGLSQSQSISQAQSQGFYNGYPYNSLTGATSGSQSNGLGGSSAASAASAATTSFVAGVPVASASAAAAAAAAGNGGYSNSNANSVATATGGHAGFQGHPGWFLNNRNSENDSESISDDSESLSSESQSSDEPHFYER